MTIKRISVLVLILIMVFPRMVYAAGFTEVGRDYQLVLSTAVNLYEDVGTIDHDGVGVQASLFRDLGIVERKAVVLSFLSMNQSILALGDRELSIYLKDLYRDIVSFNEKYSSNTSVFPFRLRDSNKFHKNKYIKFVQEECAGKVTEYLAGYCALLPKSNGMDYDIEAIRAEKSTELSTLFEMIDGIRDVQTTVEDWCTSYTGLSAVTCYKDMLGAVDAMYGSIMDLAQELAGDYGEGRIYVDDAAAYIQSMTSAVLDSNGNISISENPKLSLAYLACIAGSSVYTPFVSYSGSSEFLKSLESLAGSDAKAQLLAMYGAVKGLKKPLYRRSVNKSGQPSGSAELITVADFTNDIESGCMGALCSIEGDFKYDDVSWVYSGRTTDSAENNSETFVDFGGATAQFDLKQFSLVLTVEDSRNSSPEESQGSGRNFYDPIPGASQTPGVSQSTQSTENTQSTESPENTGASVPDSEDGSKAYALLKKHFTANATSDRSLGKSGDDDAVTYSNKFITDEAVLTKPLVMYGTVYARAVDNMTTALMQNVIITNRSAVNKAAEKHLYMNAFGDIVTEDDLVILPAAANPLFYGKGTYNPFTVAFMNSYPNIVKGSGIFRLASKADVGKYMIFGYWNKDSTTYAGFAGVKAVSVKMIDPKGPIMIPDIQTSFTANFGRDSASVFRTKKLIFADTELWSDSSQYDKYCPLTINSNVTVNGKCVFPYEADNDDDFALSSAIANSMYAYYAVDKKTMVQENQGNLNDNYITEVCIVNGFGGTDNAVGYEQYLEYEEFSGNSTSRKYKSLVELSGNLFNSVKDISGIIGIKNIYDNKIAGNVLSFLRQFWPMFLLLVMVVLLFHFSKVKMDLLQAGIFSACILGVSYLYITVLPNFVPLCFNLLTNNVAQGISYRILSLDAEHFLMDGTNVDLSGDFDFDSVSMTLYKMKESEVDEILGRVGLERKDVVGGEYYVLNSNAGVYLKNNEVCVNMNILFDTLNISGRYDTNNSYTLQLQKTVSGNVDYYVPYIEIVNSLVQKVNDISTVYKIPRNTSTFANGKLRDNYLLYSYVNSKPFLTPGDYSFSKLTDFDAWTAEERTVYQNDAMQLSKDLYDVFGNNYDWLGISSWLGKLSTEEKKTLWAQTLQDLGYYDSEWNVNKEKMNDLVSYVNYQTRKFVYDISDQIGVLSDDVMIKVVSLRALIALTQRASDFGHWMYPFTVNYEELTLNNVLRSAIISDYDKYVSFDMDVTAYVLEEYGWFNLIVFDVVCILTYVVAVVMDNIVPLFYLLVFAVIALRLCIGSGVKEALKGYLKVSLAIMLLSCAGTLSMIAAEAMDGRVFAIYFILISDLVQLAVLIWVLSAVFRNVLEFGNSKVSIQGLPRVKSIMNRSLRTNNLRYSNSRRRDLYPRERNNDRYSRYGINVSVDDFYGYGGYGDYDTYAHRATRATGTSRGQHDLYDDRYGSNEITEEFMEEASEVLDAPDDVVDDLSDME